MSKKKKWVFGKNIVKTPQHEKDVPVKEEDCFSLSNSDDIISRKFSCLNADSQKLPYEDKCLADQCGYLVDRNGITEKENFWKEIVQLVNAIKETNSEMEKKMNFIAKQVDGIQQKINID